MSSLRGARIAGKRAFSASTIAAVSSTDSVVWVRKARLAVCRDAERWRVLDRLDEGHRSLGHLAEGADHFGMAGMADEQDVAPVLDQPLGLAMDLGDQRAGRIDIGQAARPAAAAGTDLGTPWAENTTGRSSGTSSSSSTNTAPSPRSRSTTKRLWTISWRT